MSDNVCHNFDQIKRKSSEMLYDLCLVTPVGVLRLVLVIFRWCDLFLGLRSSGEECVPLPGAEVGWTAAQCSGWSSAIV